MGIIKPEDLQAHKCAVCGKELRPNLVPLFGTADGVRIERPTCTHGPFYTCVACNLYHCPKCGCEEFLT